MKVAVTAYSFYQYIAAGKMTQLETVKAAHELGFDAMEFTDISGSDNYELQVENAKKIRAEADKYGIKIIAYAIGANLNKPTEEEKAAEVERLKGQVDIAAILGAPVMRHDVTYGLGKTANTRSFDLCLPSMAKMAREVAEYAKTKGVMTCSENHGYIFQDSDRVERFFNAVAHENYGVLLDLGNMMCADEDPRLAASRLAPYAIHVHAKDFHIYPFGESAPEGIKSFTSRGLKMLSGCAIGEGDIPTKQCVAILKKAGYDSYLTVEYEGSEDCIEGIKKGLAALKSYV
jgi:sugar phosphate isomerase/epimerase